VNALELEQVSVTLGGARVVDHVAVEVEEGEWVALIGPNGAGKTTLLRSIAGLVSHEGNIKILDDDTRELARKELARRIALVPQVPVMPPDASVLQYVLLGRTPYIGYFGSERRSDHEAAESALDELDLRPFAHRRIDSLSGGERQRASLARALAQDAPILLLDEPTAALDVGRQQQVLEIVDRLRVEGGLTVFSTMHDLTLAGQYADRLLLIDKGRIVAGGRARDVLTGPLIAEHYGADVEVLGEPESGFVVVPVRRRPG
jgi:iron complex transport system ATP-binding protein